MVVNCRSCGSAMITNKTSYSWLCPDCIKYILKLDISTELMLEELGTRSTHPFVNLLIELLWKWIEKIK